MSSVCVQSGRTLCVSCVGVHLTNNKKNVKIELFTARTPLAVREGVRGCTIELSYDVCSIYRMYLAGPACRGTWMTGLRGEGPRLLQQAAQLALLLQRGEARSA